MGYYPTYYFNQEAFTNKQQRFYISKIPKPLFLKGTDVSTLIRQHLYIDKTHKPDVRD